MFFPVPKAVLSAGVVVCAVCAASLSLQDDVQARQAKLTAMAEESKKDEQARKQKQEPKQE